MNVLISILDGLEAIVSLAAGVPAIRHAFFLSAGVSVACLVLIIGGLIAIWVHQEREKEAYRLLLRNRRRANSAHPFAKQVIS